MCQPIFSWNLPSPQLASIEPSASSNDILQDKTMDKNDFQMVFYTLNLNLLDNNDVEMLKVFMKDFDCLTFWVVNRTFRNGT